MSGTQFFFQSSKTVSPSTYLTVTWQSWEFGFPFRGLYLTLQRKQSSQGTLCPKCSSLPVFLQSSFDPQWEQSSHGTFWPKPKPVPLPLCPFVLLSFFPVHQVHPVFLAKSLEPLNRNTRLENLAWSHSVFWQFIFCRKCKFMKPFLLSSDTGVRPEHGGDWPLWGVHLPQHRPARRFLSMYHQRWVYHRQL